MRIHKWERQQQVDRSIQRAVRKAILSLKPPLRAVVLRYIENLSYAEIAEAMSCSAGTVAARLSRAHRLLERKLHL
jgi:RNA polymerase sigma-70 factor (ECF subfamily)